MEIKSPNSFGQAVIGFGIMFGGLWVVIPLFDLLRVGFGSPFAGKYFSEAIGRAVFALIALGVVGWLLQLIGWMGGKLTGTKAVPPPQ